MNAAPRSPSLNKAIRAAVVALVTLPDPIDCRAAWLALLNLDPAALIAASEAIDLETQKSGLGRQVAEASHALHFAAHRMADLLGVTL